MESEIARIGPLEAVEMIGILPVIAIPTLEAAVPLADALCDGGVPAIEVTLRTSCALEAMSAIRKAHPEMTIAAGTIIEPTQISEAKSAGADFLVSPGIDAETVRAAKAANIPIVPGVTNPTEIMLGVRLGLRVLKFFPAEISGGVAALTLYHGPFPEVKFVPTGGMNMDNIGKYLSKPFVAACGGSYMAGKDAIRSGDWTGISADCRRCVRTVQGSRA